MTTVTIEVSSLAAREKIERLAKAIGPGPILKVVGQRLLSYVDESFRTRGRGGWRPLAWLTLALRQRGGDAPLQDTGRYKQSFVQESDRRTYVEVGTSLKAASGVPLGPIHEYGTGPFVIRVKNARILAARIGQGTGGAGEHGGVGLLRGGGRVSDWIFFGKEVQHPGIPARPVLPDKPTAEQLVTETVEEMIQMEADRGSS